MGFVRIIVLVGIAALALAPAALGQTQQNYAGLGGNVQSEVQRSGAQGVAGLPFTGLDLALMVGGGLALLLAGGTIRRLSARRA